MTCFQDVEFFRLYYRILGTYGSTCEIVVGFIDEVDQSGALVHFVGMPIAPCFKKVDNGNKGGYTGLK